MLEEDGKAVTLMWAGLPCKFGEATTKFPGFEGEAVRYPSVGLTSVEAVWEEVTDVENGLGVKPYIMTTARTAVAEINWSAEDARHSVRDMMSDPTNSNITTLEDFTAKTAGPGQPDQPATRQRFAWPLRTVQEDPEDGGNIDNGKSTHCVAMIKVISVTGGRPVQQTRGGGGGRPMGRQYRNRALTRANSRIRHAARGDAGSQKVCGL